MMNVARERNVKRVHPTQKPVPVMTWVIEKLGNDNVICDPYIGGGSTGVACVRLGMKFIGVEIDRRYFDAACGERRIAVNGAIEIHELFPEHAKQSMNC